MNPSTSTATIAGNLSALAEPPAALMDGPALDYFYIEMVNTLRNSSAVSIAKTKKIEQEMAEAGLLPPAPPTTAAAKRESARDSISSATPRADGAKPEFTEEEEALRQRLENIGMHVGANVAERLSHDRVLFSDTLDAIKFICKDLWAACWDKQVDNLRTNHRGVYVLQDNAFKPISRVSSWEGRADALKQAKMHVALSGGIIRGALARLGFQATVVPEVTSLPQCTFQIKLPKGS